MWMIHTLCQTFLSIVFPSYCYGCAKRDELFCATCRNKSSKAIDTPYQFIHSLYSFKTPIVRKMLHAIKYFHRKDLIKPFAEELALLIKKESLTGILVPIPMHPLRRLLRGYNHAEVLAHNLSLLTGLPCTPLLTRTSLKRQQVKTKSRSQRLQNQHNSFRTLKKVEPVNYILIDDVTTTGATLLEARKVLLKNGAAKVFAVTIAH